MKYISTRDTKNSITPLKAVLKGIAEDGGLFVPESLPKLSISDIKALAELTYPELAAEILSLFIDIDKQDILELTQDAYKSFDSSAVVPIVKLNESTFIMELWHGPTLAFKDVALQMLPRLMSEALKREQNKKVLILTATSGDTGKAALEGFKNVENTGIVVFYPSDGVSDMQKLQMVTQEGKNVFVCAVEGNFDDAQSGVKKLFGDHEFNEKIRSMGYELSSANSINIGRLVPQIVYYFHAYASLINSGDITVGQKINFTVPTGNFGNILAAYYAKNMGLPINKLICASNENSVLTDFFKDGLYTIEREFFKTMSPSMDILISSNLERLLFELCGRDAETVCEWMKALAEEKEYSIDIDMVDTLAKDFYADFCDDIATSATILKVFDDYGYLLDTHTAVGVTVYDGYVEETGDDTVTVIDSTASPFKFAQDVYASISGGHIDDAFDAAKEMSSLANVAIPPQIAELKEKPVRFKQVAKKEDMGNQVLNALEAFNG